MNDFYMILTTDEFFNAIVMFYGLFTFVWLIKLGINCILSIFSKI